MNQIFAVNTGDIIISPALIAILLRDYFQTIGHPIAPITVTAIPNPTYPEATHDHTPKP